MIEFLIFVALGSITQIAPVPSDDPEMARCENASPQRDNSVIISSCTGVLERGTLHGAAFARVQALRARAYVRLRDYRHAAPDYRAAFHAGVTEPAVANGLCWSLTVLGESLDEARAACDARLREAPDDVEALDSRGLLNLKQGRSQDAWNDYDRAVRINPQGVSWFYGRGIAAIRLGRVEEGRQQIEMAEIGYPGIGAMFESYGVRP